MFGAWQGLSMMLLNILRIPPGVTVRKAYGGNGASTDRALQSMVEEHDLISTVVDITADDVCIGNTPAYLADLDESLSPTLKEKLVYLCNALNVIVRWAAIDLLKIGYSVFILKTSPNGRVRLIPQVGQFDFYMTAEGDVKTYLAGEPYEDALIFLNYSKESLVNISARSSSMGGSGMASAASYSGVNVPDEDLLYQITPEAIQLKNVGSVAKDLFLVERSMYRYRAQLSRIVRLCTVDVGSSQGEKNQEIIDDINASINADSMSLSYNMEGAGFDDSIPVHIHRKGIGKPEIYTDVPDFDIDKLADLDYTMNRFFLATRFPKSYADFNTGLNDTAVSLIRGDIRYSRMVERCRLLIEDTINLWLSEVPGMESLKTRIKMTALPNSEDDDVIEALSSYTSFVDDFFQSISGAEDKNAAEAKLGMIKSLLGDSANLPSIQACYEIMAEWIDEHFVEEVPEEDESAVDSAFDVGSGGGFRDLTDESGSFDEGSVDVAFSLPDELGE